MFRKLKEYAKSVDAGLVEQKVTYASSKPDYQLHPENNYYENYGKHMEIKDYIESHVHGIAVNVSGGEKVLAKEPDSYKRRPIIIRTFKINDPYAYNEVKIDGIFMDERDCPMRVYDGYIGFFVEGSQYITTGTVSMWEQTIKKWMDDNFFSEFGYYCSDNQVFKFSEDECEIIVPDITREVIGVSEIKIEPENMEYDSDFIILCRDKQILLRCENYYIMEK